MKALICTKYGPAEDLIQVNFPTPEIGPNQILLRNQACAINFPDTLIIEGKYQFKPEPPFVPGAEVCSIVKKVGKEVKNFKPGDRVIAKLTWGGLAEYSACDEVNAFAISDDIESELAAATLMTYGTSYHALVDRAQISEKDTVLVLGAAGGIGYTSIQIAKLMGAKVIAAASTNEKLEFCKAQGADFIINYTKEDIKTRVKEITNNEGVSIIVDPVGGKVTEPSFRSITRYGKHLVIGFTDGEIPKIPLNLPLLKSASITGVFWSSFCQKEPDQNRQNVESILELINEGKLRPTIQRVYDFNDAKTAIQMVKNREALGKVVVRIEDQ